MPATTQATCVCLMNELSVGHSIDRGECKPLVVAQPVCLVCICISYDSRLVFGAQHGSFNICCFIFVDIFDAASLHSVIKLTMLCMHFGLWVLFLSFMREAKFG
jgi:hypothetical protein